MDTRTHCLHEQVLLDHVFGELPPDDLVGVDEHLNACPRCRARRSELAAETQALGRSIGEDVFPSADRVKLARQSLEESFARYEREREPVVVREPVFQQPAASSRWLKPLAAAAVFVLCGAAGIWYSRTPGVPEGLEVLTRARGAESTLAAQPLFQRFRVELTQVAPLREQRVGHLETWSDPGSQRFASHFIDPSGSLRHAVWNRLENREVVTSVYNPSVAANLVRAAGESAGRGTLLGVAQDGLTTEALAAGFVRWIEARSWRPVSLTAGIVQLVDERGMNVELSRPNATAGVLRLSARRQTGERVATITLDVDDNTYQPIELRIRFETADGVAEVAMAGEETRVLAADRLDPVVFEPRIPSAEISALRRVDAESPLQSPRGEPAAAMPGPQERLNASLRVLYAIHEAGGCVGRMVNVTRQESGVTVSSLVNSPEEKARVLDELSALELPGWVSVEVRTQAEAAGQAEEGAASRVVGSEPGAVVSGGRPIADFRLPIQNELETYFSEHALPGSASISQPLSEHGASGKIMAFANEAVSLSESGLAHAMELRRLAENYGDASGGPLNLETSDMLREMLDDHLDEVRANTASARALLLPVLEEVAKSRGAPSSAPGGEESGLTSWSDACMNVFGAASRIHRGVVGLLAVNLEAANSGAHGVSDTNRTLVDLLSALRSVESDIAFASRQVADSQQTFP